MQRPSPRRRFDRTTDIGLRIAGLALIAVSWRVIDMLIGRHAHAPGTAPDMLSYGLATVGFVAGGGGSVLVAIGRHIFDEVDVSARWARHAQPRTLAGTSGDCDVDRPASRERGGWRDQRSPREATARDTAIPPARAQAQR